MVMFISTSGKDSTPQLLRCSQLIVHFMVFMLTNVLCSHTGFSTFKTSLALNSRVGFKKEMTALATTCFHGFIGEYREHADISFFFQMIIIFY